MEQAFEAGPPLFPLHQTASMSTIGWNSGRASPAKALEAPGTLGVEDARGMARGPHAGWEQRNKQPPPCAAHLPMKCASPVSTVSWEFMASKLEFSNSFMALPPGAKTQLSAKAKVS